MSLKFLLKNQSIFFCISIIFLLQIRLSSSEDITINDKSLDFIYISNTIYYIKNDSGNNNLYKIRETNPIKQYFANLSKKSIIKIDEENFVIFGITNSKVAFDSYKINGNEILELSRLENTGISYNGDKYNIACSSVNSCFISFISNNFYINKIDLVNKTVKKIDTGNIPKNAGSPYNILCDSLDGNDFVCILIYKNSNNEMVNFYVHGNINNGINTNNIKELCGKNCYSGNIVTEKGTNRYLICYEIWESTLSIVCKYFSLKEGNLLIDSEHEPAKAISLDSIVDKSLILKIYENSVIIELESKISSNLLVRLLICSLDFTITIMKYLEGYSIIDLFNDNNHYYYMYENNQNTIVKEEDLIKCNDNKYLFYSSDGGDKIIDFADKHDTEHEQIIFSLDKNTKLKKGSTLLTSKQFYSLKNNEKFTFVKPEESNALKNYYCYAISGENTIFGYYKKFSLICQMTLKLCYSVCDSCNLDKESTSIVNYCNDCKEDYYGIKSEMNNKDGFNCYKYDEKQVESYYLKDEAFYPCDKSCKTCIDNNSCKECKGGYYFKKDKSGSILYNEKCLNSLPKSYYLDTSDPNDWFYKECYDTCLTCSGSGSENSNNCINCKSGYITYFDKNQCTINKDECKDDTPYWEFKNNNVFCISKDKSKEKSIVVEGESIRQCVDECHNYIHPFQNNLINPLYTFQCGNQKYCLTVEKCRALGLIIDNTNKKCRSKMICKGSIDVFRTNPFESIYFEPINKPDDDDAEQRKDEINKRIKIIKMFKDEDATHPEVISNFDDNNILEDYIKVLNNEKLNYGGSSEKLYLITYTNYLNFTISIYPLDVEDFVYEQILSTNNLGFVNMTKMFPEFIKYEATVGDLLLVCLMEYHNHNSAINDLNYYFYSLDENAPDDGFKITVENNFYLKKADSKLEISYSLSNYNNSKSELNERNTQHLVDNIKEMAIKYPEIDLSNSSDPFYNSICFIFSTDFNTDITLNDRRNEYYINASLCENNCQIISILRNESKNPRSLCSCDIKSGIKFNTRQGEKDEISLISSYNAKAVSCISTAFGKNLSSNAIFWIFLLAIIFLIAMVGAWLFYGKNEMKKILGVIEQNNDVSEIVLSIPENDGIDKIISHKSNNENIKTKKMDYSDKKAKLSKNIPMQEKREKNNSNNQIKIKEINQSNPPRKRELKAPSTKAEYNDKSLISSNEPSFCKNSMIKPNENNTEISFDNILDDNKDNKVYIDNLVEQRNMLENNYIKSPVEFENLQKIHLLLKSLYSLDNFKRKKFNKSYDDIHVNSNYKKFDINQNRNLIQKDHKNERSKYISKLLDGEKFFDNKKEKDNESEMNDMEQLKKMKELKGKYDLSLLGKRKNFERDDRFFFPEDIMRNNRRNNNLLVNNLLQNLGEDNNIKKRGYDNYINQRNNGDIDFNNYLSQNRENNLRMKYKNSKYNSKSNRTNKNEYVNEMDSNRKMKDDDIENQNNNENDVNSKDKINKENKGLFPFINQKILASSVSAVEGTESDKPINIEDNFLLFYWKYFNRRELCLVIFRDKNKTIPYYVRWSCFVFCLIFIFLLNCFFFFESNVHKRYMNALEGKNSDYNISEFVNSIVVAFLTVIFKMLIIKLLLFRVFKIGIETKKLMRSSIENDNQVKKNKFLKEYKLKLIIYFSSMMALSILFTYFCVCYGGVFPNSVSAFFLGFLFSMIFAFILCGLFCLIIVTIHKYAKKYKNKCLLFAYAILSTIY